MTNLSHWSLCVHLQIEYTNGPHVPLAKVICANVKSDKWVMWRLWEKAVNFYNVLNRSERASVQAGREAGMEDWSGARRVGCHAVVLCCRQGTSVIHSLSPCFTSLLAPRLYFPLISSHQLPSSSQPSSKAAELADTISNDCSVKCIVWHCRVLVF